MTDNRIPMRVSAGILRRNGTILVCRRSSTQDHAGKWEFPGGKCEPGEPTPECLRRELLEELGIDAVVGELLQRIEHRYPERRPIELFFHVIDEFSGEPRNLVFAEIRWVLPEALPALDFLEADRPLVLRLADGK